MEMLGASHFVISDRALREGLIIDWMLRHDLIVDRFVYQGEIRRRTVMHHASKYGVSITRAERIAAFALDLWDQTRGSLHQAPESSRQLLWAAHQYQCLSQAFLVSGSERRAAGLQPQRAAGDRLIGALSPQKLAQKEA